MEITRTIYRGISKSSFKSEKEYSFTEAQEILGPCKRKEIYYAEQEQDWQQMRPLAWSDKGEAKILEKYDVWLNERGDMLLAIPLPKSTLNIKDFDL